MIVRDILKAAPPTIYAAVDGALLEDAPRLIDELGLERRPLYRGALEEVGIQLVSLSTEDAIDRFFSLFADVAPAVFWSWSEDRESLYRHLRSLGKVEVPVPGTNPIDPEYEQVLFRHADPNSLIRVLRVLTDTQRTAFLGEARGLILEYVDHFGDTELVRVPRDGRLLFGTVPLVTQSAQAVGIGSA